ncbi:hypothetical protein PV327_010657 [Microctonus hyperodae]|uniref:DUF4776 domain-containing protein n=1 Tax=Microctonus hyperodae TaxID=165561 RepID=A0AA39C7Y9_MICHY|nr:hypothetical protein PV327_010657 [Microctonus hyperodae]
MDKKIQEFLSPNKKQCLYILEFLINCLNLNSKNIINETDDENSYLKVELKFSNLPMFIINEDNNLVNNTKDKLKNANFSACGISCLFTKSPIDFLNMIKQNNSLKIEIYKLNIDAYCPEIDNEFNNEPICQTTIRFDEYFGDKYNMTMNDCYNSLESFEIEKSYELLNAIEKSCGTIDLFLCISCCGTSIITQFHHDKELFVFKNYNSPNIFEYLTLLSSKEKYKNNNNDISKVKTIVRIVKLYQDLSNELSNADISMKMNEKRMRGGGLDDNNINVPLLPIQSMQTLLSGAFTMNIQNEDKFRCSNNSRHKIDCFIRAFKNTQEFVDNIGVTGMPGLSLMDKTESPYFTKNRYRNLSTTHSNRKKYGEINLLNDSKDINILLDNSNCHNAATLMEKNKKCNEHSLQNNEEFIQDQNRNGDNELFVKDSLAMKKKINKNNLNGVNKSSALPNESMGEFDPIIDDEIIDKIQNKHKRKRKKEYHLKSQQRFLLKSKIKPSKRIMKLVRSAASRLHFGHKSCVEIRTRVPGNMGWLWNIKNTAGEPKAQIGWKPGAISRRVWHLLKDAKVEKIDDTPIERPLTPTKDKKSKISRKQCPFLLPSSLGTHRKNYDDKINLPPTLHIHRKDGTYYITICPINRDRVNNPEIQETIVPLQFKVTKNKEEDGDDDSSSIASDIEFEFSPPIADTHYRQSKKHTKSVNTQVQQQEIIDTINDSMQLMKTKRPLTRTFRKLY